MLRDPDDANDAAQESLVKLVQKVRQFRGESQFSTWLHRLVVNTCKDVAQARWTIERRTEPQLDPVVLEFDHVRGKKTAEISALVIAGRSSDVIAAEMEKCEIRCANCHRIRTIAEAGRYRLTPCESARIRALDPVAQLDRAAVYGTAGRGFEPLQGR